MVELKPVHVDFFKAVKDLAEKHGFEIIDMHFTDNGLHENVFEIRLKDVNK